MKKWIKITCLLLAMVLLMPIFPAFAEEVEVVEQPPKDIVLLLDCSISLDNNDPQLLCLEAFETFMSTMPSQDARISVVCFGYRDDKDYYQFQMEDLKYEYSAGGSYKGLTDVEARFMHMLVPLGYLSEAEQREQYRQLVVETAKKKINGTAGNTPIATAIATGVDILESSGTAADDGSIILVSDGIDEPNTGAFNYEPVLNRAGEKEWPVYCVELNYNNPNPATQKPAQDLMDKICAQTGNDKLGRLSCGTPTDVHVALQRIFCDIFNLPFEEPVLIGNLPAEYTFNIGDLVSEATINIFGSGIQYIELTNVAQNTPIRIDADIVRSDLEAVVKDDRFYSVKMIVPKSGEWRVNMYGDESGTAQASLLVNKIELKEMGLTMVCTPSSTEPELIKSDSVTVNAFFEYRDIEVHDSDFYAANPAKVRVYCSDGSTKEFTMEGAPDGYHYQLPMAGLPSGVAKIQVVLEHAMFVDGVKASNVDSVTLKNLNIELAQSQLPAAKAYVNSSFEPIDLSTVFNNPDGDKIEYTMSCVSDRTVELPYTVEADYLKVEAGMVPGTYTMEISAKDPDMTAPLVCTVDLTVEDRPVVAEEVKNFSLWIDAYSFQKKEKMEETLDLSQLFFDPDGVAITYAVDQDNAGVTAELSGASLHILPAEKGETVITVTGNDGVGTASTAFTVKVVSGKAVYWQQNWIFYVIGLAVLVVIAVTIVILLKNKRVKGEWEITVDNNGDVYKLDNTMNIAYYCRVGKKGKFLLKDLLAELILYMDNGQQLGLALPEYFTGNEADKVEFIGVMRKKGCVVAKIPANDLVKVSCNGVQQKGKASVFGGSLVITVEKAGGFGDRLSINMYLK